MAAMGKKHPLDIFRHSSSGFDSASRERRVMLGRVVTSAPRATTPQSPADPPQAPAAALPPAVAALRARLNGGGAQALAEAPAVPLRERVADPASTPRPLRPPLSARPTATAAALPAAPQRPAAAPPRPAAAPKPPRAADEPRRASPAAINRVLLASACVLVSGLALWTLAASVGGPTLKSAAPASAVYRIQAATYPGTPAGQASAFSARDVLRQDFEDVDVVAYPGSEPNVFSRFELVVGKAEAQDGLGDELGRLRGIKNWPGSVKAPFKDALVAPFAP
jgi:hypothetical protein